MTAMKYASRLPAGPLALFLPFLLSTVLLASAGQGVASDRLRITLPSGAVIFDQTLIEGQEADPIGIGFFPPEFVDLTDSVRQVLALLDPGTTIVSDRVFVEVQPSILNPVLGFQNGVNIFMCSDSTEGVPPPFSFVCPTTANFSIDETGTLQNVTSFFTILNGSGITVEVQSDIDRVAVPRTLLLLSSGLVGLAAYARRRRSRS